jgi:hypothetical protein
MTGPQLLHLIHYWYPHIYWGQAWRILSARAGGLREFCAPDRHHLAWVVCLKGGPA